VPPAPWPGERIGLPILTGTGCGGSLPMTPPHLPNTLQRSALFSCAISLRSSLRYSLRSSLRLSFFEPLLPPFEMIGWIVLMNSGFRCPDMELPFDLLDEKLLLPPIMLPP